MIDEAFFEYATRYMLVPGRRVNNAELIESIGLDEPLPPQLAGLFELSDDLGIDALVLTDSEPLLKQWNPFSGRWPLYTEGAFGAQLLSDHRWLQRSHEAGAKALHSALHEVTHTLWASWGQLGLLNLLPRQERARFHLASEACAVLMSDLEGHAQLLNSGLLERYWPASTVQSHAVAFSPVAPLRSSGLDRESRASWLFELYLKERRDLPGLPEHEGHRIEALAFLIEEASYAEKAEHTMTPAWLRSYWERPELEAYLRDFVPPHPLELPHLSEPITSVEGCVAQWEALTVGATALGPTQRAYLKARLSLQRVALKVCELEGALESYRLIMGERAQLEASQLVTAQRAQLLSRLHSSLTAPIGHMSEAEAEERVAEVQGELKSLEATLQERCGGLLCFEHPHLDRLSYTEHATPLRLSPHERLERGEAPRELTALMSALHLARGESKLFFQHHREAKESAYQDQSQRAEARFYEAQSLIGRLELSDSSELRAEVERWLSDVQRTRSLWLPYPLQLMSACPFVDPLVGFRYQ